MHHARSPLRLVLFLCCAAAVWAACEDPSDPQPQLTERSEAVVYGEDDRTDVYAHEDPFWRDIARTSIVALIPRGAVRFDPSGQVTIQAGTLGEGRNLCDGQRFYDDPTAANCSGTLIDDDLVLTAGHCVETQSDCEGYYYVFDYHYAAEGVLEEIDVNDVYECRQLAAQELSGGRFDWGVVQLDRVVTAPHAPAPVWAFDEALPAGAPVTVIGFGSGIPAKIDTGGRVIDPREDTLDYFEATTDTFGGNSGSGVFNEDGEVVGILVRGEQDYVNSGGCTVVNELADDGSEGAEDITYVGRAIEDLCDSGSDSLSLCGPGRGNWCSDCMEDTDCLDGWQCVASGPDATQLCAAPCMGDGDCRDDHVCEDSICVPSIGRDCYDGDVWEVDGCGTPITELAVCADDEYCASGRCLPRGEGDTCETALDIEAVTQTLTGDLGEGDYRADHVGECAGNGPDRVYRFVVTSETAMSATASGYDTVLYLRDGCGADADELACNDDIDRPSDLGSFIEATLAPGEYFLFLDAWNDQVDAFELDLVFEGSCSAACAEGQTRCGGGGVQSCRIDAEGCATWGPSTACPAGTSCADGVCVEGPGGDVCSDPTVIEPVDQMLSGSLVGYGADEEGSCAGEGPERIYTFELDVPAVLIAESDGFDTVLYVRADCTRGRTEVACNDDIETGEIRGSYLEASLEPGQYFLFMDAWNDDVGDYSLSIAFESGCDDVCTPGDRRCSGNDVQLCDIGATGCSAWQNEEICGPGEVCESGACRIACVNECDAEGVGQCTGGRRYRVCGQIDDDPCLEWGPTERCSSGESCTGDGICTGPDVGDDTGIVDTGVADTGIVDTGVPDTAVDTTVPIDTAPDTTVDTREDDTRPDTQQDTERDEGGTPDTREEDTRDDETGSPDSSSGSPDGGETAPEGPIVINDLDEDVVGNGSLDGCTCATPGPVAPPSVWLAAIGLLAIRRRR